MTYASVNVLDVVNAVDSERAAIWQRHTDWSEEQRQLFYEHRKTQIAASFGLSPSEPRGLQRERTLARDQIAGQGHTVGVLLMSSWYGLTRLGGWPSGIRHPGLA